MSLIVDSIFTEWRASLPEGSSHPNTKNGYHLFLLKEICLKRGIPENIVNSVLLMLEQDTYKLKKKDTGEISVFTNKDNYEKALQSDQYEEPEGGEDPNAVTPTSVTSKTEKETERERAEAENLKNTGGLVDPKIKKTDDQLTPQEQQLTVLRRKDDQLVETQLRLFKDDPQDKGGLGTPESRTGETATVYAAKKIKDMIPPKTYQEAREQVRKELLELTNRTKTVRQKGRNVVKKALLTKEWVEAGLNCLDWMEKNIGIENLDEVGWDTDEGNELVGATDHGTSADMFVKTKEGKVIGISLKKSMKVFIVNGGYDKKIGDVVELLGMKEGDLPEEATKDYYNTQRDDMVEIANSFMLTNPDVEEKVCAHVDRLTQNPSYREKVFTSKALNAREDWLRERTGKENIEDITCDDFYDAFIRKGRNQRTGNDIKMIVSIAKLPDINEATGLYTKLRSLDGLLGDNLMNFLKKPENESKFKTMVMKETHIEDILFGTEGGALDALEVVYGEKGGGVSMSPQAVSSLFGISDVYARYQDAKGDKKEELKEQILAEVNKKLVVTKEGGKPVIGVTITSPNPEYPPDLPKEKESVLPVFTLATRTRGIGSAPVLEMYQGTFGGLAFKNGNVDIKNWSEKDRGKVITDQIKAIKKDIKDEALDPNSDAGKQQIIDKIKQLEYWDSNNKSIKDFKKDMGLE